MLRQLYRSLAQPRQLSAEEAPFGEFLRSQGALAWESVGASPGLVVRSPQVWRQHTSPGVHSLAGDGEGGCWSYHYQAGRACLGCVLLWWLERHHEPEWFGRIEQWPDFRLSWPAESGLPEVPESGWIHYLRRGKVHRGQVLPHPRCGCGASAAGPPAWNSWVHPVTGPVTGVVERQQDGLWRVSLRLGPAASSGAHVSRGRARRAALAEACERWAALQPCDRQRVRLRRLGTGGQRRCWSGLVYLGEVPDPHGQQLSHGLACGSSLSRALRSGFWELLERDGLRRWWRAWSRGQSGDIARLGDNLWVLPGPVFLAFYGRQGRGAWGSAAGPHGAQRARNEALHNYQVLLRKPPSCPENCTSFADHAAWGWNRPLPRWRQLASLPLLEGPPPCPDWRKLAIERPVYYARLVCPWAELMGWTVVKVLSPTMKGLGIGGKPPYHPFS
ncbi:MAG: YcaO-like family protein [Vulcanimicrobiota bacterium]